jgi:hypothetical protein
MITVPNTAVLLSLNNLEYSLGVYYRSNFTVHTFEYCLEWNNKEGRGVLHPPFLFDITEFSFPQLCDVGKSITLSSPSFQVSTLVHYENLGFD